MQASTFRFSALAIAMAMTTYAPVYAKDRDINISCNASSDYNFTVSGQSFVFEGKENKIPRLVLSAGTLLINGKQAVLSAPDQKRIDQFEAEMRILVPESRQVVSEAINMAYDALSQVSASFTDEPEKELKKYQQARAKSLAGLNDANTVLLFNEDAMDNMMKPVVAKLVPGIVAHAIGFSIKSVFMGERKAAEFEAKMNAMEKTLDASMDKRAKALQPLADTMCKRIQRMDVLDNSLEIRLINGKRINFIDVNKAN